MSKFYIKGFNIDEVTFEETYINEEYETTTCYFIVPKEWLGGKYPEAVSATISLEYPNSRKEAFAASVEISPTRERDGEMEDYDWTDADMPYEDIARLISLAETHERLEVPV